MQKHSKNQANPMRRFPNSICRSMRIPILSQNCDIGLPSESILHSYRPVRITCAVWSETDAWVRVIDFVSWAYSSSESGPLFAALTISIQEVNSNVQATFSGSINNQALPFTSNFLAANGLDTGGTNYRGLFTGSGTYYAYGISGLPSIEPPRKR